MADCFISFGLIGWLYTGPSLLDIHFIYAQVLCHKKTIKISAKYWRKFRKS
jgi:hypothetical protein